MKAYIIGLFFSFGITTSSAQQLYYPKNTITRLTQSHVVNDTFNLHLVEDTTQYTEIYSPNGSLDFTSDQAKKMYLLNKNGVLAIYDKKYIYLGYLELKKDSLLLMSYKP